MLVVCAYDPQALDSLAAGPLSAASLQALGARAGAVRGSYMLSGSATPQDRAVGIADAAQALRARPAD